MRMTSDDDPRAEIAAAAREQQQINSRENAESTFTRRILHRFAPKLSIPKMIQGLGKNQLSLDLLPQILDNLPIRFAAEYVRYLDEITASDLLGGKLANTPLWRAYVAAIERRGVDLRNSFFGLITPWVSSSAVVLHNWPRHDESLDRHQSYGRFVLTSSKHNSTPILFSLEPLTTLLDALERHGTRTNMPGE